MKKPKKTQPKKVAKKAPKKKTRSGGSAMKSGKKNRNAVAQKNRGRGAKKLPIKDLLEAGGRLLLQKHQSPKVCLVLLEDKASAVSWTSFTVARGI